MTADPYHVDIIREKLTRTLPAVLPEVVDELGLAVQEYIGARDDGGTHLHIEYMSVCLTHHSTQNGLRSKLCQ